MHGAGREGGGGGEEEVRVREGGIQWIVIMKTLICHNETCSCLYTLRVFLLQQMLFNMHQCNTFDNHVMQINCDA